MSFFFKIGYKILKMRKETLKKKERTDWSFPKNGNYTDNQPLNSNNGSQRLSEHYYLQSPERM